MTLPVVFTANGPSGYSLTKSLRFRSSASAYLNRSFTTPTSQQKGTMSFWVKRGSISGSTRYNLFSNDNGTQYGFIEFNNDNLNFSDYNIGQLLTTQVFRDPSAWYNIIIAIDTTQATAANRYKMYVNGNQVTAFSTATYCSQNANSYFLQAGSAVQIGAFTRNGTPTLDGYLAEYNFIDGQQLTPSSFGSTNSLTGVWQPAKYTGTYGTNGFYLPFTNTTSTTTLGYDFSGNGNNWTTNNISLTAGYTYDSMVDVPTLTSATVANYPTISPIDTYNGGTITNANLLLTTSGTNACVRTTMAFPTTGKYYFEATDVVTGGNNAVGLANRDAPTNGSLYLTTGAFYTAMFSNAVYGFALNFDSLTYTIYKNNSVDSSGSITSGITYGVFMTTSASGGASTALNFGQQPFAYTPPTGYVALNTYNLPTSTIVKGNTVMDVNTWTGTGATNVITNSGSMKPDFVWIKGRSNATYHMLTNSVTGATKYLYSNDTLAEATWTDQLTSFNSNGFTLGADTNGTTNYSGRTFVGWQWQAGQGTTSSNTNGSITSTVSVNATAGFSIVSWTYANTNQTVGHGLGVAPKMIITKDRNASNNWVVWHNYFDASVGNYLNLNSTSGTASFSTVWGQVNPTSTTFGQGAGLSVNGDSNIAYCWAEVAGFSKFGSYTGNGSTDGPFIYLGFRPKYVMIKRTDSTGYWIVEDSSRNTYNAVQNELFANASDAEYVGGRNVDFLSNGFKLRHTDITQNANGGIYIFAAFAENPFKNALAR